MSHCVRVFRPEVGAYLKYPIKSKRQLFLVKLGTLCKVRLALEILKPKQVCPALTCAPYYLWRVYLDKAFITQGLPHRFEPCRAQPEYGGDFRIAKVKCPCIKTFVKPRFDPTCRVDGQGMHRACQYRKFGNLDFYSEVFRFAL